MATSHRKLLNESAYDPLLAKFCATYCDADHNPDGNCSFKCIDSCPSVCKIPIFEIPQLPPSPSAAIDFPAPGKSPRLSLLLTVSVTALAAAFFLFTCYTIYRLYSNWCTPRRRLRRQQQEGDDDLEPAVDHEPAVHHPIWYIRTVGLQPSVIGAITIFRYNKGEGLIDGTDCSVCLNEFQEDETLRLLPKCNHAFHVPCIDTWLRSHTNCPLCRAGIMTNPAFLPSQAQDSQIPGPGPVAEARRALPGRISRRIADMVESESESSELRIGIVSGDETVSGAQNEPKASGIQPMRRSISMDSLSAIANSFPDRNSANQLLVESKESAYGVVGYNQSLLKLVGRQSIMGSTHTECSFAKRSLSCSGNMFVSRHASKNQN